MADNKTKPTAVTVEDFLAAVEHPERRQDGRTLDTFFRRITGRDPVMWGPSIIGYGRYRYRYDSGREGEAPAVGFSPRKAELSLYVTMTGCDYDAILSRLGPHRMGKACLYVKRLSDIDMAVLEELTRAGMADLDRRWPITD